jgi:alkanesulfonate monooxygenase SsuD/methylene tetrahydromethanopterin reductase-like flavin-dependent oxidoreductase (luciferase family)
MSKYESLKIGVQFQTHVVSPTAFRELVADALDLGVDSVFLWDHLVPFTGSEEQVSWDTWTLLGSFAEVFRGREQVLGVLVSPLSIREPAMLARSAVTIALLGNGTFVLGVGSGGYVHDDNLTDAPKDSASRMNLFTRRLKFLREEVSRLNTLFGTNVKLWVGGSGERVTIPSAVKYADGWSGFGPPTEFANKAKQVAESNLEISVLLTPNDLANDLPAYVDAGADQVIRSLRPSAKNTFDLAPIAQMLSERAQLIASL